jgi:arylsulfatase A-like enzyme
MSDNGFHLGEKDHWQKATLWEEATHVLMMFRVPGMTRAGGVSRRFVSLQDIYPTLADLCGLKPPADVAGRSLVPLLKNPDAEWKSTALSAVANRYVSIRDERFRYARYSDDQEELYDCEKDPHEWTNQISNPQYASALKRLRASVPALSEMMPPVPATEGKNDDV